MLSSVSRGHKLTLPLILITALTCCLPTATIKLNLSSICSGNSLHYCSLTNITNHSQQPLMWIAQPTVDYLKELMIYDSSLVRLPGIVFEIAPNLQTLIVHNCNVNSIMVANFMNASQLHKLVLQDNRMFEIPERVFDGAFALEELYLAHNTLHMVHRYAFAHLQRLKYLDLQDNGIRSLPQGVFDDLINLEHIDLSWNELEIINTKTFAFNTKLKNILLADNKFVTFEPSSLMHFEHLRMLDMSNTLLEELQVQSVDLLLVQGSKLKRCIISGSVIKLNAANNALQSFTIHDKLTVRELDLHGNLFESLEGLVGMLNLQRLDISKNQLTSLQNSATPMYLPFPNLLALNLASNHLQNLSDESFMLMLKLKSLDLSFNHMTRLNASAFRPLLTLEKLYLEGNRLFELDYIALVDSHNYLREVGIFENDWELRYLKHMKNYFYNHGIRLPMRFAMADSSRPTSGSRNASEMEIYNDTNCSSPFGVSNSHPHWTSNEVFALITLTVGVLSLVLLCFHILQEEGLLPTWCRCYSIRHHREEQPLREFHHRLREESSSV